MSSSQPDHGGPDYSVLRCYSYVKKDGGSKTLLTPVIWEGYKLEEGLALGLSHPRSWTHC